MNNSRDVAKWRASQGAGKLASRRVISGMLVWIGLLLAYVVVVRHLRTYDFYLDILALANDPGLRPYAVGAYVLGIALAMMTPFSSSALLLFAALEVFGPITAFIGGYLGGATASVLTYGIGRKLGHLLERSRMADRLDQAHAFLSGHPRGVWAGLFLARAVPTPLYDVWGYASGIMGIPFWTYLIPSSLGGAVPLAVVCFVPGVLS